MGCAQPSGLAHESRTYAEIRVDEEINAHTRPFHEAYVLREKLGRGAFASVYTAHRVGERKLLAVKVTDLRADKGNTKFGGPLDKIRSEQVMREVKIMSLVKGGRGVVELIEAYTDGNLHYMVLEKCDESLVKTLQCMSEVTETTLKHVFQGMLCGLATVHKAGIAHRDVKLDNFLCVGRPATIKLCDFGFAAVVPGNNGLKGVFGTPPYMAPEMLTGSAYGTSIDVWSFGVTVYALFFGCFPYVPTELTGPAMKAAIIRGTPAPQFQVKEGVEIRCCVSQEAKQWVRRLLCRTPEHRPTVQEVMSHRWFASGPMSASEGSLLPILSSAGHGGLFEALASPRRRTDIDDRLDFLQGAAMVNQDPVRALASPRSLRTCVKMRVDPEKLEVVRAYHSDESTASPNTAPDLTEFTPTSSIII